LVVLKAPLDFDRLRADLDLLQRAEFASSTERGYSHDARRFAAWCSEAGLVALPATPDTLALFLADMLAQGRRVNTIARYVSGIAWMHRRENLPSPVDETVRKTVCGARRIRWEPLRQMRPLTVAQLRRVVALGSGTPMAARDKAIVLIGFSSGLRRSNLAALQIEDVEFREQGLLLRIRREKQDRRGISRQLAIPYGRHALTCAVTTLSAWLDVRGREPGPLFTRLDHGRTTDFDPLTPHAIYAVVKKAVALIGLDPCNFGPHSLRAGLIVAACLAGMPHALIAVTSGHKSMDNLQGYCRPVDLFEASAAGRIGL